jgi:polyisoprenoid-binding protein YceI
MNHLLIIPMLFVSSLVFGAEYTVLVPQQSGVTFVSKQMNVPVEGSFRKFTVQIVIDPAKPENGKAHIEIDLASVDTGNSDADQEVAGQAWFDTKNNPVASFTSGRIVSTGKGQYQATGKMTIKGKTLDIKTPFTLRQSGGLLLVEGAFPLKRLDFGIGSGIWADTSVVADEVQIRFRFTITAAK